MTRTKTKPTKSTNSVVQPKVEPLKLNEEQKQAIKLIGEYPITVLHGLAGTAKTTTATYAALKYLEQGKVDKIIITRPAIAVEDLGYLPGELLDKTELPYAVPIIELINKMGVNPALGTAVDYYSTLKASNKLEFVPIATIRGRTFDNSFILVDEAENLTPHQVKTILTRIGKDSTMVFTGDVTQSDLPTNKVKVNGLEALLQLTNHTKYVRDVMLVTNMRNPIIDSILKGWELVKV